MMGAARRLFPPDLMALALVIGLSVDCIINKGVRAVKADVSLEISPIRTQLTLYRQREIRQTRNIQVCDCANSPVFLTVP